VELGGVDPGGREEVEVVREFLLETLQMHPQGTLSADVVHPQEVVHALLRRQAHEEVGGHTAVCPENVPVVRIMVGDHPDLDLA